MLVLEREDGGRMWKNGLDWMSIRLIMQGLSASNGQAKRGNNDGGLVVFINTSREVFKNRKPLQVNWERAKMR